MNFGKHALGLALAGLVGIVSAGAAQAQERVGITHSTVGFAFLPSLVADAMGYYEDAGLDVEIIKTGSGSKSMAAAIAGDADVVLGSPISFLQARRQGAELVQFSALVTQVNSNIVVTKEWASEHGITPESTVEERLAALDGITVGVTGAGSGSDQTIRYLGKLAGLDPDRQMTIIGLGSDAGTYLSALELGRVDGVSISAPTSQIAIEQLGGVMLFYNAAGAVPAIDGYFYISAAANQSWLDENPQTAQKIATALQRALSALNDPATTLEVRDRVHAEHFPAIDKAVFDALWPNDIKSAPASGQITREMMEFIVGLSQEFTGEQLDPALIDGSFTNVFAATAEQQG